MSDDDCDHACVYCVTEARCERSHLAALGVCDSHIRDLINTGIEAKLPEAGVVGHVMRMTGGRANPARVAELVAAGWRPAN